MPTSRPMASLWTRRRNTDDTSTAAWTCGWFIASDSFAKCATHSSASKTFASAGPPVARRCSARMPLSVSVTVGEYQLVTMEKCVHAHLTYSDVVGSCTRVPENGQELADVHILLRRQRFALGIHLGCPWRRHAMRVTQRQLSSRTPSCIPRVEGVPFLQGVE